MNRVIKRLKCNKNMAGYRGKIEPFDENIEKWASYVEGLKNILMSVILLMIRRFQPC